MNKKRFSNNLTSVGWEKLFRVMKLSIFLIFVFVLDVSASVYSQNSKISLKVENGTLAEIFERIEKQSEFRFFYQDEQIQSIERKSIDVSDQKIDVILYDLLHDTGLVYKILDRHIVLYTKAAENVESKSASQQSKSVSGKVTDSSGAPIPGVTVLLKGSTTGVISDSNGSYSFPKISENAILQFSFVGMKTQEITVGNMTTINVVMKEEIIGIGEVVAIGYGTQKKILVTTSVATVKSEDFLKGSVKDAAQLIQGKVAGLIIGTPSGDPNSNSQILLRGTATLSTSTQPLILVDGIPGYLNTVAPEDIESIDVLKDGSAAAIYGTRGTNGVILIATKRASGIINPTITYNSYMSTQSLVRLPKMLTAQEYRDKIAAGTVGFQDYGASTDWMKEMTNKTPLSHNHNLTLRGGSVKTNYLASLNYRDQVGEFITSESKTFNGRFDVNHSMFNDKLKINVNYISSYKNAGVPFENSMFRGGRRYNPTAPLKNPDGTWFENGQIALNYNPVAWLREQYGDNITRTARTSGSVTWTPINDLSLKLLASNEQMSNINSLGRTKQHYVSTQNGLNGEAYNNFGQAIDNLLELTALYSKVINSHSFSALAGYSYQDNVSKNGGMMNYNFPAGTYSYPDAIQNGDALSKGLATMSSSKYASNLIGIFGRVTYNYKEKYLLMANLRYEGSSKFVGTDQPWGTFPSVSVGWRISEENFMKSINFVSNLKLRAGYGVTGTAPDALFLAVSRLGYGARFLVNGVWTPGLAPVSNPNPSLKWEIKKETNIGLDFSLLKGTLGGTIDLYQRKTDGLLYDYAVPSPPNLYPTTKANVGVMENKGIEVALNYIAIQKEKFTWNTSVLYSTNRNKLVSLANDLYTITNPWINTGVTPNPIGTYTHRVEVGQPIGNFWGFKVTGVTPEGNWIYEDKDGKPASTATDIDKKVIGNGLPKSYLSWNNSFRYGNFDLNITMRGAFGFQIINEDRMIMELPGFTTYSQLLSTYDKAFGTAVLNKNVQPTFNSYYVENGDYWKIDNITLGYNFNISKSAHVQTAHLYVSSSNTWVITGYKGTNPEVNQLGLSPGADNINKYPSTRMYTIGLNITIK